MNVEFTFVPCIDAKQSSSIITAEPHENLSRSLALAESLGFNGLVIGEEAGDLADPGVLDEIVPAGEQFNILVTHRVSRSLPTLAARQLGLLQAKFDGRLTLRLLPDFSGEARGEDRPRSGHAASWRQADEYVTLLKRLWANERPFDHEGLFYSLRGAFVPSRASRALPVRMKALSGTALKVAARHADTIELAAGSPQDVRVLVARARATAAEFGRQNKMQFALPLQLPGRLAGASADAIHLTDFSSRTALLLMDYVQSGVNEFMVHGTADRASVHAFCDKVLPVVRNSAARVEDRSWPSTGYASFRPQSPSHY